MALKYKNIEIADAGFVINLPDRTDRKEYVTNLLNELELTGWQFENGVRIDDSEWRRYGCTQVYINIFEKAINENYESIIVFEDDIKLMNGISLDQVDQIFNNIKKQVDNYDLIALGTRPLWGSQITKDSDFFGTLSNSLCTQSFLYTKEFMTYAYNTLKDYRDPNSEHYKVVIDEFICDCSSHQQICKKPNRLFRTGITLPMMFTQKTSYSDNEMDMMNYEGYIEDSFWVALNNGKNN